MILLLSDMGSEVDDVLSLGILHHLCERFSQRKIYTLAGSILIALNPYFMMPELYSKEGMAGA